VPVKSIRDLIAYAKANPGKLSYGTPGSGSSMHFAGESLKALAGVFIVHIPYRGAAPAVSDLLGGQVQIGIVGMPPVMGPHKAGKIHIIAVTSEKRSAATPDIRQWRSCRDSPATVSRTGRVCSCGEDAARGDRAPRRRDRQGGARTGDPRQAARRRRRSLGLSTADTVKFFAREKATYVKIAKARQVKADD